MKILVNKKIKLLFFKILGCISAHILLSAAFIALGLRNGSIYIFLSSVVFGIAILVFCCRYFRDQQDIMESAAAQITECISGNRAAHIECDEEGELYRLFHEVNSLVSILNAHAENEGKARKFMKDTISDISHQLKTPLAALNIYNGIIQEEVKDLPTIKEFTALSEQELDRIETLVQNLLKIAKLDAGTIVIDKTPQNVSEMLNCIERQFIYRAEQEKKNLYFYGNDTVTLLCDRVWLIEAIGNIVKNAFDHTESGNTITVEWKQFASVIQILVRDDGSGIHPEDLHYIFKRFYRSRFSKDTQGVGLGLSLAKAIFEAHSGTIEVDSELGIGTTFTINFLNPTKL